MRRLWLLFAWLAAVSCRQPASEPQQPAPRAAASGEFELVSIAQDDPAIRQACTKAVFYAGAGLSSCYRSEWHPWVKGQERALAPAEIRRPGPGTLEDICTSEVRFKDGSGHLLWTRTDKFTSERVFWLVDAHAKSLDVVWVRASGAEYFGKNAAYLREHDFAGWFRR